MGARKAKHKQSSTPKLLKNPFFYTTIIGVVIIIVVSILLISFAQKANHERKIEDIKDSYIFLGEGHDADSSTSAIPDGIVTSYDDFKRATENIAFSNDKTLTESDFKNYNYAIVVVRYDECSEHNLEPSEFKADTDQIAITFDYDSTCGVCAQQYLFYAFKLEKKITNATIAINYNARSSEHCNPSVVYKPIIYLYPTKTADVKVELDHPELLSTSYPKYQNSWQITAEPSGKLTDKTTGRELYALYWEGKNYPSQVQDDGFVVKGSNVANFLEDKLALLGLNAREAEEFIVYWLPKMEHNAYNYVRFEASADIDNYMPLKVTPQPDTTIRLYMSYKALDTPINVKEQQLISPTRTGFTVVEWGGMEIK